VLLCCDKERRRIEERRGPFMRRLGGAEATSRYVLLFAFYCLLEGYTGKAYCCLLLLRLFAIV